MERRIAGDKTGCTGASANGPRSHLGGTLDAPVRREPQVVVRREDHVLLTKVGTPGLRVVAESGPPSDRFGGVETPPEVRVLALAEPPRQVETVGHRLRTRA